MVASVEGPSWLCSFYGAASVFLPSCARCRARASYEEVPCVNVKRWKMLNNLIRQRSHLAPGDSARVRYSLVACENIRFSSLFATGDVSFLRAKCPQWRRARRNGCFRRLTRWALMWAHPFFKYPRWNWGTGPVPEDKVETLYSGLLCSRCLAQVLKWRLTGRKELTTFKVTYRVLKVWTQHYFVPVSQWYVICVSPWLVPEQQSVNRPSLNSVGTGACGRTSAEVHMFRIFVYQS